MNNSTPDEKDNPVVTLKAQAEKFDFKALKAKAVSKVGWIEINSGFMAFKDLPRMRFVVNKKDIDEMFIPTLIAGAEQRGFDKAWNDYCKDNEIPDNEVTDQYKEEFESFYNIGIKYTNLLPKEDENKNYRPFAKEVFKEMFKHAKAEVPNDSILEELVINCNQAGYEGVLATDVLFPAFNQSKFTPLTPQKTINVNSTNPRCVKVESCMRVPVMDPDLISSVKNDKGTTICDLQGSIEFTLESQDGKDGVTYKDGGLSLTVPRKLRDYKIDGRSLFDIIKEYFYKFCEKLGFKLKIEHGLGDPLEVNSCMENPNVNPLDERGPSVGG